MDLGPEQRQHGRRWAGLHGGYFSDPAVARPLIEAIRENWDESRPDVVVDLGGGTGFLLSKLRQSGIGAETALVNLDGSAPQLAEAGKAGLSCACGSVESFRRGEVVPAGGRVLFLMRSVLHYAGETGLDPLLRHLRGQAETGEFWIHQTASFERGEDADCLNALYRDMRTGKWYPTVADLRRRLSASGWPAVSVSPAPTLRLDSAELGLRYGLDAPEIRKIGEATARNSNGTTTAFRLRSSGFAADLHYHIFVCRAGGEEI